MFTCVNGLWIDVNQYSASIQPSRQLNCQLSSRPTGQPTRHPTAIALVKLPVNPPGGLHLSPLTSLLGSTPHNLVISRQVSHRVSQQVSLLRNLSGNLLGG